MTAVVVVTITALAGLAVVFGLGRVLRRDHQRFDAPLPALTPLLRYRVTGGQDPVAVALALDHAGFRTVERYVHGDAVLDIAVHTGSAAEREAVRSMIVNAPTLGGAEQRPLPPPVVFVDEEARQP